MNPQDEFRKISTSFNVPVDDVVKKHSALYAEEISDGRTVEQATEKALRRVYLSFRRENMGKAARMQGLILGVAAEFDNIREMKELALEKFKENPARALAEGYVDTNGQPIDNEPFFGDNKTKNPRFKKPLPEHDYSRKVVGLLCALSDDGNTAVTPSLLTTMWCRGDAVSNPPSPFRAYNTAGIIKNQGKDEMTVNSSKATRFQLIQPIPSRQEVYTVLRASEALNGMFMQAEKLADWMKGKETKLIKSSVVFIEGDVLTCDPEINDIGGSWNLVLDDGTENGLRCFVPKHIPADCAEDDRVVAVANVRPATEKYAASLNVMGLLLHPDYTPPIEVPKLPKGQETLTGTSDIPKAENAPSPSEKIIAPAASQTPTSAATPQLSEKEKQAAALKRVSILLSQAKEIDYLELVKKGAEVGLTADLVERSVRSLMMAGECYEPKVGKLKWVVITPGAF